MYDAAIYHNTVYTSSFSSATKTQKQMCIPISVIRVLCFIIPPSISHVVRPVRIVWARTLVDNHVRRCAINEGEAEPCRRISSVALGFHLEQRSRGQLLQFRIAFLFSIFARLTRQISGIVAFTRAGDVCLCVLATASRATPWYRYLTHHVVLSQVRVGGAVVYFRHSRFTAQRLRLIVLRCE